MVDQLAHLRGSEGLSAAFRVSYESFFSLFIIDLSAYHYRNCET